MNPNKFCFIACISSDDADMQIAQNLCDLSVPEGYEIEYLGVREAPSIAAGYNEAIDATDACYKIFVKESAQIFDADILTKILSIFEKDKKIDAIGVLGTDKMPTDMVLQHGTMYGVAAADIFDVAGDYIEVICISDDFMVIKGDYRFDDISFDGSSFYNVAICADILRNRKKIVVANQDTPWLSEYSSPEYDENFEKYRRKALEKFSGLFNIDKTAKRLGIVHLKEISANDMVWALLQTKHDVEIVDLGIELEKHTQEDLENLCNFINNHHLDALFTYDFCPVVSDACEKSGTKYLPWVYDAPQQALYYDCVKNSCNYVFSFDKDQVKTTKENGCPHVFHQPLATNITRFSTLKITPEDKARFSCDISFIGSLYSDNPYNLVAANLRPETKNELDEIINSAMGIWDGKEHICSRLSEAAKEDFLQVMRPGNNPLAEKDPDVFIHAALTSRYIAHLERIQILRALKDYDLKFHTHEKNLNIEGITAYPTVDYNSELPKAYALSRINLNITLHSITSGIPLRVFDIMGAGGFVLSNYQPEIPELFEIGKEIEVFHSIPELKEKVDYYLTHEDERAKIAKKGYEKTAKYHTCEVSMGNMLRLTGIN